MDFAGVLQRKNTLLKIAAVEGSRIVDLLEEKDAVIWFRNELYETMHGQEDDSDGPCFVILIVVLPSVNTSIIEDLDPI